MAESLLSSFLLYLLYFLSYRNHVRQFLPLKMHTTKLQKLETTPGNWWCSFITLTYRSWNITKYEFTLKWSTTKFISYTGYVILAALTVGVVAFTFYQLKRYRVLVHNQLLHFLHFAMPIDVVSQTGLDPRVQRMGWSWSWRGCCLSCCLRCDDEHSVYNFWFDARLLNRLLNAFSPRAMFLSQVYGTATGCIMSPFIF